MKLIRNGNKLTMDEMPSMVIAEFSPDLAKDARDKRALEIEIGLKMLEIYDSNRTSFHITAVVDLLRKFEKVYEEYGIGLEKIRHKYGDWWEKG